MVYKKKTSDSIVFVFFRKYEKDNMFILDERFPYDYV